MEDRMSVPKWLEQLLSTTTFFSECQDHSEEPKNECNMFCLDCGDKPLCFNCISSHEDHRPIQIRRSSYQDVVRAIDIQNDLDISEVQTYVINSFRVVFLNKRDLDHPKTNRPGRFYKCSSQCEMCQRNLVYPFRFCSLGCMVGRMENENGSSVTGENGRGKREEEMEEDMNNRRLHRVLQEQIPRRVRIWNRSSQRPCSNSMKRKGIPRRAPFY